MVASTSNNPGRYDDLCAYVREQAAADGAVVIVINGNKGMGFSVQASGRSLLLLPSILENVAHEIRNDIKELK